MIRRSHRGFDKNNARTSRVREKAAQLRNRVKQSTQMFMERHEARMEWWKRTFRVPTMVGSWILNQVQAVWAAFLMLLGLAPNRKASLLSKGYTRRESFKNVDRRLAFVEGLEQRQLLATLYVDNPGDYVVTTNNVGGPGADPGDIVTWKGSDGATGGTGNNADVPLLIYGTHAFGSIQDAVNAAGPNDVVKVGPGIFAENVTITTKGLELHGAQTGVDARTRSVPNETVLGGTGANNTVSVIINADDVVVDGFQISQLSALTDVVGVASYAVDGFKVQNNIISNQSIGIYANSDGQALYFQNYIRDNNQPGSSGGAGIYSEYTNQLQIANNKITGHNNNNPMIFASTGPDAHKSLLVTSNEMSNEYGVFSMELDTATFGGNKIRTNAPFFATALTIGDGSSNVVVVDNDFANNLRGVRIQDFKYADPLNHIPISNVTIKGNDLSGNLLSSIHVEPGHLVQTTLNASGNYFGTTDPSLVPPTIDAVGVNVDFSPMLAVGKANYSNLIVHGLGANSEGINPIQNAYSIAANTATIQVRSGAYGSGNVDLGVGMVDKAITLAAGSSPGQVTINGNLAFSSNDTVPIEIVNPADSSAGYDNFKVNGTVSLGNATLTIDDTGSPWAAGPIVIIDNDSTDSVSGTFSNAGGMVTGKSGKLYLIKYDGGDGNDVVLEYLAQVNSVVANDTFVQEDLVTKVYPNNGQFQINLDSVPTPTVVSYNFTSSVGNPSTFGDDYTATADSSKYPVSTKSGLLTIPANTTEFFVNVNVFDDKLYDGVGDEDVILEITGSNGMKFSTMAIVDNEVAPQVQITATTPMAPENPVTAGKFTVALVGSKADSDIVVQVDYDTPDLNVPVLVGGASIASTGDYNLSPATPSVTISAGQSSKVITVTPVDDSIVEENETVTATITSKTTGITVTGSGNATVTITDTDAATVKIAPFTSSTITEDPSNPSVSASFQLTKLASTNTVLEYSVHGDSKATANVDFTFGVVSERGETGTGNNTLTTAQGLAGFSKDDNPNIAGSTSVPHLTVISADNFINNDGSADVYVFYTSKGGAATFDIDDTIGFNSFLEVLDSKGVVIASNDNFYEGPDLGSGNTGTTTDSHISVVLAANSIYFVRVTEGTAGASINSAGASTGFGPGPTQGYKLHLSVEGAENYAVVGANSTSIPLTLTVLDDNLVEANELVKVHLNGIVNADSSITLQSKTATDASRNASVTINDNDKATITVTSTKGMEPGGGVNNGVFTFVQSEKSSTNTEIQVKIDNGASTTKSSSNGTIADPADHSLTQTVTVTIVAGQTSATLTVPVIDSDLIEEDETLVVNLALVSGKFDSDISLAKSTASMLIGDEDAGVVNVDAGFAVEGGTGKFTFILSQPPAYPIGKAVTSDRDTVIHYTVSGTATPGVDYAALSGIVTIPAFSTSTDVLVDVTGIFDDALLEGTETIIVTIDKLSGTTDSNIGIGVGSHTDSFDILDNDSLVVKVKSVADAVEGGSKGKFVFYTDGIGQTLVDTVVTLEVAPGGTAVEGNDFAPITRTVTIPAGLAGNSSYVEIDATGIYDDALFEGNESVILKVVSAVGGPGLSVSPDSATGLIIDNETGVVSVTKTKDAAEGITNGEFLFTLDGESPIPTIVKYEVLTGNVNDATPDSDYTSITKSGNYGTITFNAFQTTATISVNVMDDGLSEGPETVRVKVVEIVSGKGYTPSVTPATVTIYSDQEVKLSVSDATGSEAGPDSASFTLSLYTPGFGYTASKTNTVVNYKILTGNPDDATNGSDYETLTGQAIILAGDTTVAITVDVKNDKTIEADEKVRIELVSIASGSADITVSKSDYQGEVTILDDDAGYVTVKATKTPGQDNPASSVDGEFTFYLSQPSSTDTVITYSVAGTATDGVGNDYATLSGVVTIKANELSAVVPVNVFNDNIIEGTETVKVTMTSVTGDPQIGLGSIWGPTVKFQQGFNAYTGTIDTYISNAFPLTNFSGGTLMVNPNSLTVVSNAELHSLIKFDNIFGDGAIPFGSNISAANLVLSGLTGSGNVYLYESLIPWNNAATWNNSFGGDGVDAGDTSPLMSKFTFVPFGLNTLDVTSSVESWVSGGPNYGWVLLPGPGSNGAIFGSSEKGAAPYLTVALDLSATVEIIDTDVATVSVTGALAASEPTTNGKLYVSITNPSSTDTEVHYTDLLTGTAISGSDYKAIPDGVVTIPAGLLSTWIEVVPLDDSLIESAETVKLQITKLGSADPQITLGGTTQGTVVINDNDFGLITFGAVTHGKEAGPVNGTAVVQLSTPSDTDTVLSLIVGGTATPVDDYAALGTKVTIPANHLSTTITIAVVDDGIHEAPIETVTLKLGAILSGNVNIFGTPTSTTVNIEDNEQPLTVNNVASKSKAYEGGAAGEFTFQLNYPSDQDTVITYSVLNPAGGVGEATLATDGANPDYNGKLLTGSKGPTYTTGTVTISKGATNIALPVVAFQDFIAEGNETVKIKIDTITNSNGGTAIGVDTATVTIQDQTFELKVRPTDSPAAEPGPIPGSNGQYTFTLSNPLPEETVVEYTVLDGPGVFSKTVDPDTGVADYVPLSGKLTIPANTTEFTLDLTVINDFKVEGDETVTITLVSASSTGPSYKAPAGVPTISLDLTPATQFITDDDSATVTVSGVDGSEAGQPLAKYDGKFIISQTLKSSSDTFVTYTINTKSSTATAGSDYVTIPGTLTATITAGQTSTVVVVDVLDDLLIEGNETVVLDLVAIKSPTDPQITLSKTTSATVNIVDDDEGSAYLVATSPHGYEPGTNDAIFTVYLSHKSATDTVIGYSVVGGDATYGLDYTLIDKLGGKSIGYPNGVVTIPANQTSATIVVDVLNDNIIEDAETVEIKLTTSSTKAIVPDETVKNVTILEDWHGFAPLYQDSGKVVLSVSTHGSEVGPTNGKFLVTLVPTNPNYDPLDGPFNSDEDTVLTYTIMGGTATQGAGNDYTLTSPGTVTIQAGKTTAFIDVTVLQDLIAEPTETIFLQLSPSLVSGHKGGIVVDTSTATMNIVDNDGSTLTISSPTVTEGDSGTTAITFTVTSPVAVAGGFNVNFSAAGLAPNAATYNSDYVLQKVSAGVPNVGVGTGYLTFSGFAGETQTITFDVYGDTLVEATEQFKVTLNSSTPGSPMVITGASGTGTITNDDTAVFTIADVSVIEGTDTTGVIGDGTPAFKTLAFEVKSSNKIDIATVVTVSLADITATGGNFDSYLLAKTPVPVPYTVDYDTKEIKLTFAANTDYSTTGVPFTIRVNNDGYVEGGPVDNFGSETFKLSLSSDISSTRSTDTLDTAIGTIIDDDSATISIVANDNKASEYNTGDTIKYENGQFTITQTAKSSTATVISYTVSGTATSGDDFKALSGSATIPVGQTQTTINIEVVNDPLLEIDETVIITLDKITSGDPNVTLAGKLTDTVTIYDNDSAKVTIKANDPNASEDPIDNGQFTLTLSGESVTDTIVKYKIATGAGNATNGSDYTFLTGTATIPAGKSATTIDVVPINDNLPEGPENVTLTLTGFDSPTNADISLGDDITATVVIAQDYDGILISVHKLFDGTEGGLNGSFVVKLTQADGITPVAAPPSGVTVPYSSKGGTATAGPGGDYVALTGFVYIGPGETTALIDVVVQDDLIPEPTETVIVTLTPGGYTPSNVMGEPINLGVSSATVSIFDNDSAPPAPLAIEAVKAGSSGWATLFNEFVDSTGAPTGFQGYTITPADQTSTLPWFNINRLYVQFSDDPDLAALTTSNFILHGLQGLDTPTITGVSYDAGSNTAMLQLSGNVTNDKLRLEINTAVTHQGSPYNFTFNVLPGDAVRNSMITSTDPAFVNSRMGSLINGMGVPVASPSTGNMYSIYADLNGSASITSVDPAIAYAKMNPATGTLPSGSPGELVVELPLSNSVEVFSAYGSNPELLSGVESPAEDDLIADLFVAEQEEETSAIDELFSELSDNSL